MSPPIAYARTQAHRMARELGVDLTYRQADQIADAAIRMFIEDRLDEGPPPAERAVLEDMLKRQVLPFLPEDEDRYQRAKVAP